MIKHSYLLDGTKILKETWGTNILAPLYDNEDSVCGISYNGNAYYFVKNLQGDIIAIANASNTVVARYTYDAWGKCTVVSDNTDVSIATINPFRYRGYYFDDETGLYYLQSRYYDPEVGRFINGDSSIAWEIDKNVFSSNLYSYCQNDSVNQTDFNGNIIAKIIIRAIVGAIFGAAMQYLADVLKNIIDCIADNKKITKKIWDAKSSSLEYISSIVSGACDATLKIGAWKSFGISVSSTLVGQLMDLAKGKSFDFKKFIKALAWNAFLTITTKSISKKFTPKQGKELNKYIKKTFKVKGTKAYKEYWDLLRECVEWNGFVISTVINSIKSGSTRIINFAKKVLKDCVIKAFETVFEE